MGWRNLCLLPNERKASTILLLIKLSLVNYEKGIILRPAFYCQASRLLLCILPRRDNRALILSEICPAKDVRFVPNMPSACVLPAREGLNFTLIFLIKSSGSVCTLIGASSGYRRPKQGSSKQTSNENFQMKMHLPILAFQQFRWWVGCL